MGILTKLFSLEQPVSDRLRGIETAAEYRERWISIRIMYFAGFLMYYAFGTSGSSNWPYLNILDPDAGKTFLVYLFAAPSILQLVCSPFFGWWKNRLSSVRILMAFFMIAFIVGHVIYAVLEEFQAHRKYIFLLTRVLIGISSVACTIYRAYVSSATTVAERTRTMSYLAFYQTSGLLGGSVVQSAASVLGEDGFYFIYRINMYTMVGWVGAFLGLLSLVLFVPSIFKDHNIALKEAMKSQDTSTSKTDWQYGKLEYLPITIMVIGFAVLMLKYMEHLSLLSPIALDQFNWTNEESLFYLGILMTAGALVSCVLFLLLDYICKRFSESSVLVYGAMLALFLSQLLMIPSGSQSITDIMESLNSSNNATGCPPVQEWCERIPPVGKVQFTLSYTFLCVAFSIGTTLTQAVFSKLLGPRPQGTWMALLTCAGSAARILGPGSVTIYVMFGTYWTFGSGAVLAGLILLWMWVYRKRLQPAPVKPPATSEELKVLNSIKLNQ